MRESGNVVAGAAEAEADAAWWVAFRGITGIGPVRMKRLVDHFGTLQRAWEADSGTLRKLVEDRVVQHIVAERRRGDPVGVLRELRAEGVTVITLLHDEYPKLLREISAPPPVLFLRGALEANDRRAVAIIGTRRASAYGREMARSISRDLAAAGVTIVSGLARGIDGIAHQAALEAGGRTIAVLGSGVHRIYPPEHRNLAQRIMEQGALVSEFLPDAPPDAPNFPARNRLISGMSLAVVVVEAPQRSGALITVDFAADQGRDVFAVPGSVLSHASTGCNRILRDGARLARDAQDVLDDLGLGERPAQLPIDHVAMLDESARRVLALTTTEPQHIDEIGAAADMEISALSATLMELELQGFVRNLGAQFYARSV